MFFRYRNRWQSKFDIRILKSQNFKTFSFCFFCKILVGRITFELYNDICPITCKNFLYYCRSTDEKTSYKRCLFHRIVKNFMIQSGDFSQGKSRLNHKTEDFVYSTEKDKNKKKTPNKIDVLL